MRNLESAQKTAQALRMRSEGCGYAEIGKVLGISTQAAWKRVSCGLDELVTDAAEVALAFELARLDSLQLAIWPQATSGDCRAIDRVLRIMERRAKLLGLDSPVKVAPTDPTGTNPYEAMGVEELRALAKEIAGFDAT